MISGATWPEVESWLSPSKKQRRYPCSGPQPLYQDLSTCYDWPVKRPLSICQSRWKELRNARPVWVCASQPPLLTGILILCMWRRLITYHLTYFHLQKQELWQKQKELSIFTKIFSQRINRCESCHTPEPLHNGHLGDRTRGGRGAGMKYDHSFLGREYKM